jgi:Spy/CpxP family protein refolding chaperone
MKPSPLILVIAGAALGGGAIYLWQSNQGTVTAPPAIASSDKGELDAAKKRIAELEQQVKSAEIAATPKVPVPTEEERAADPEAAMAKDIQGLLQESRPLLNRLAPMFRQGMMRGIDRQVEQLAADLGLNDAQKEELRAKLTAMGDEEMKKFNDRLADPSMTPEKLFQEGGRGGPFSPDGMNAMLKETLTPEQYEQYDKKQTAERVQRLERQANWQTDRLGRRLNLTEQQKDQVFGIMVKSSDPNLEVETGTGAAAPTSADADRDAAIKAILTPEQRAIYEQDAARDQERRERWSGMWGGRRPGQ